MYHPLIVLISIYLFVEVSSWTITGERQAARIRSLYLKNILRQDISFFDKETNTGEVIGRMSGDTVRIQEAMGEKVFIFQVSLFSKGVKYTDGPFGLPKFWIWSLAFQKYTNGPCGLHFVTHGVPNHLKVLACPS
ncbi:putative ABC transporter type 1, transmembrane domain-containing protein [Helianthus annuus]|nr:putative ABC transporter type 1, transmembrane domain-containing protein [Helianthus annuus]